MLLYIRIYVERFERRETIDMNDKKSEFTLSIEGKAKRKKSAFFAIEFLVCVALYMASNKAGISARFGVYGHMTVAITIIAVAFVVAWFFLPSVSDIVAKEWRHMLDVVESLTREKGTPYQDPEAWASINLDSMDEIFSKCVMRVSHEEQGVPLGTAFHRACRDSRYYRCCVTESDLKDRYRSLCKAYHPDNAETGSSETFREIKNED